MAYFKNAQQEDNPEEGPDMVYHGANNSSTVVFNQNHLAENSEIETGIIRLD